MNFKGDTYFSLLGQNFPHFLVRIYSVFWKKKSETKKLEKNNFWIFFTSYFFMENKQIGCKSGQKYHRHVRIFFYPPPPPEPLKKCGLLQEKLRREIYGNFIWIKLPYILQRNISCKSPHFWRFFRFSGGIKKQFSCVYAI